MLGVPTVWLGLLQYLEGKDLKLDTVDQVLVGGSAAPYAMIKAFDEQHDAFLTHGWGMTEMSPLGTINAPTKKNHEAFQMKKDISFKPSRVIRYLV